MYRQVTVKINASFDLIFIFFVQSYSNVPSVDKGLSILSSLLTQCNAKMWVHFYVQLKILVELYFCDENDFFYCFFFLFDF